MASEDILTQVPPLADHVIAYGDEPEQFGELRLPGSRGRFPVVMNIHGGFWRAKYSYSHAGHFCSALTKLGMATWNVEYRRAGMAGGGWPGTLHDILAAYRKLRELDGYGVDPRRVVVMGHSAGGHLALCAAAYEPAITRIISLAGITDTVRAHSEHLGGDAIVAFLGGTPTEIPAVYRECDPMQLSIPHQTEQWLVHGDQDDTVPSSFSADYVTEKRGKGESAHLLTLAGWGHYEPIDPRSEGWGLVSSKVSQLLQD